MLTLPLSPAIIVKNFNRGIKLSDNSNRYAHTCKHCGINFPKGRVDNLVQHAVRLCPAINLQARAEAVADYGKQAGTANATNPTAAAPALASVNSQQISGHGLDALAYAALNDGRSNGHDQGQTRVQDQGRYTHDHVMIDGGGDNDNENEDEDNEEEDGDGGYSAAKRQKLRMGASYTMDNPPPRLDGPVGARGRRVPSGRGGRGSRAARKLPPHLIFLHCIFTFKFKFTY